MFQLLRFKRPIPSLGVGQRIFEESSPSGARSGHVGHRGAGNCPCRSDRAAGLVEERAGRR